METRGLSHYDFRMLELRAGWPPIERRYVVRKRKPRRDAEAVKRLVEERWRGDEFMASMRTAFNRLEEAFR